MLLRTMLCVVILMIAAEAQSFEVASVKRSGPQSVRSFGGGPGTRDPGQIRATQAHMHELLAFAFNVEFFQISGPAWFDSDSDLYDIVAKPPVDATREQAKIMMQNLLRERFHLELHREAREFATFDLVITKGGIRFKDTAPDSDPISAAGFPALPKGRPGMTTSFDNAGHARLNAYDEEIFKLVGTIRNAAGRPIVDKTGLQGHYDFILDYDNRGLSPRQDEPDAGPSLSNALETQLGLKLQPSRHSFDVIVVEKADKNPVEN